MRALVLDSVEQSGVSAEALAQGDISAFDRFLRQLQSKLPSTRSRSIFKQAKRALIDIISNPLEPTKGFDPTLPLPANAKQAMLNDLDVVKHQPFLDWVLDPRISAGTQQQRLTELLLYCGAGLESDNAIYDERQNIILSCPAHDVEGVTTFASVFWTMGHELGHSMHSVPFTKLDECLKTIPGNKDGLLNEESKADFFAGLASGRILRERKSTGEEAVAFSSEALAGFCPTSREPGILTQPRFVQDLFKQRTGKPDPHPSKEQRVLAFGSGPEMRDIFGCDPVSPTKNACTLEGSTADNAI